jgi:hypothetical protein
MKKFVYPLQNAYVFAWILLCTHFPLGLLAGFFALPLYVITGENPLN